MGAQGLEVWVRRVFARRVGGPKFRAFFSLSRPKFRPLLLSSGPLKVCVWASLWSFCETPAGLREQKWRNLGRGLKKQRKIVGGPEEGPAEGGPAEGGGGEGSCGGGWVLRRGGVLRTGSCGRGSCGDTTHTQHTTQNNTNTHTTPKQYTKVKKNGSSRTRPK